MPGARSKDTARFGSKNVQLILESVDTALQIVKRHAIPGDM
jgi:hypothetical protein